MPRFSTTVTDRASLDIDFGPRSVSGRSHAPEEFRVGTGTAPEQSTYPRRADDSPVIDYLGQVLTDNAGRLIVLGGRGTHVRAGLGGHHGRALRRGDQLALGPFDSALALLALRSG